MRLYANIYRKYSEDPSYFSLSLDVTLSLEFGTQLNGGFYTASFDYSGTSHDVYKYYRDFIGAHVVLTDHFGRRLYEGQVVDASTSSNSVKFSCHGYYGLAAKKIMGMAYGAGTTVLAVVKDCVSAVEEWKQTYAFLNTNTDAIVGERDYTEDVKVSEALEDVLSAGYSETDAQALYFAIWDHRTPHLFPASISSSRYPEWAVNVGSLTGKYELNQSLSEVFNRIWGRYDDTAEDETGPTPLPSPVEDNLSQGLYGIRDGFIDTGKYGQQTAQQIVQAYLDRYRYPFQVFTAEVSGVVRSGQGGFLDYPYMMRAGQFVVIEGLDPLMNIGMTVSGQMKYGSVGMIMATSYSSGSNSNKITFGSSDQNFEYLMARYGLGGGLK